MTKTTKKLKILVFGAGAIGTYVGGSLASEGHEVVFLEREAMIAPIKDAGLTIKALDKTRNVPNPTVESDLSTLVKNYQFDLAILAVKAYDTDSVLITWKGLESFIPPVVCLQNGVENEEKLAAMIGEDRVISGTVTTAVGKPGIGQVVVEKLRGIGIAGDHHLVEPLVDAMNKAGLKANKLDHAAGMKWSKMLTNLLANASSAILQMSPAVIFNHSGLYAVEAMQIRETLLVMQKHQIPVIDLPGTPVRLMAFLFKKLPFGLSRLIMKRSMIKGRGEKMPSFYLDVQSGRGKSEVGYLNGAVVRFAKKAGLPAPVNAVLNNILSGIVAGSIDPDQYNQSPSKFLEQFK